MKVLIICNCATGLETFRGMLIRELENRGNRVSAIVPISNEKKEIAAEGRLEKMNCNLEHISVDRRGMNPFKDSVLFIDILTYVKRLRPDLVITYTIKPNIYGGVACGLLKIPYAVNITGLGTAFQHRGILYNIVTRMYKVALRKAKIVFFENSENRDAFVKCDIVKKAKTHVLAGAGVDLDRFQYLEYPEVDNVIRFLFIGRIMKEKGVDELFTAMSTLHKDGYNCELDLLGDFEEEYAEVIKGYEKEGWLHYWGYQNDVRPYIKTCHCFVLPSWHEGMANTNLECAASGRPVVTSNIPGCREAIIDGKSGYLVERKNASDLYRVLKNIMLLSYDKRRNMGMVGREYMEAVFDKQNVVYETINYIYKECVDE